jgi:hypothetical protein
MQNEFFTRFRPESDVYISVFVESIAPIRCSSRIDRNVMDKAMHLFVFVLLKGTLMQTPHASDNSGNRGEFDFNPEDTLHHRFAMPANPWRIPFATRRPLQLPPKPSATQRRNLAPLSPSLTLSPTQWSPHSQLTQMPQPQQFVVFGPDAVARWYKDQGNL